jgi:DNA-binding IclR family transcriptional regulator
LPWHAPPVSRTATGESSLARAVRIFEAFTAADRALPVSEIARRAGLPVSTTSRMIAELAVHGLLDRGPGRTVRMGVRMWELGSRASPTVTLREAALPFLQDLQAVVGHHVQLAVLEGKDVLVVERLSARDTVVNYGKVAGRLPLHATALGQVFLAYGPPGLSEHVLTRPLEWYTDRTTTDPAALRVTLGQAVRQGFAVVRGTLHEDAAGLAVPVRDGIGGVVAALSVIVPDDGRALTHVSALLAAARGITRSLSISSGSET